MALVSSSPSASTTLFQPHHEPQPTLVRPLPQSGASVPAASASSLGAQMSYPQQHQQRKISASSPGAGLAGGSGLAGGARGGAGAAGGGTVRPLPSPQPSRARTSSAPYADQSGASSSGGFSLSQVGRTSPAGAGSTPLPPSARAPSRSSSTPPVQSPPSAASSYTHRPSPTPTPGGGRSSSSSSVHSSRSASYHAHSASSSSSASTPAVPAVPRLPAALHSPHQLQQPLPFYPQQPPMLATALPSFAPQTFSPAFAQQGAGWPQPAYPFIPSPHPNAAAAVNGYNFAPQHGAFAQSPPAADSQKRLQHYQQQWTMEAMKQQQAAQQAAAQQNGDWQSREGQRRRATSGPASGHSSPTYYTTPLPYPPSPAPSAHGATAYPLVVPSSGMVGATLPTLPPGAMLPAFAGHHGYPTPPGSVEGASRNGSGGESGSSSGGSGTGRTEGGYHPYRRDRSENGRSAAAGGHRANPSTSSSVLASGVPARAGTPRQQQQHARSESSASISGLATSNFPPLPSSSSSSLASSPARSTPVSSSASSTQQPPSFPRSRTSSQNSSASSVNAAPPRAPSSRSHRPRGESFESGRSATPVQAPTRTRPSPLGVPQAESTDSDDDDGAESDGTAEATATIGAGLIASPSVAGTLSAGAGAGTDAKGKAKEVERNMAPVEGVKQEKEKKGMKSRFKKAFGVSAAPSSSSNSLADVTVDGRGPKQLNGGFRARKDSASSDETAARSGSASPATMPYATHAARPSMASLASTTTVGADDASTRTTARKPPSSNRFRLLNPKLNSSTDNISISSTVSSASVMIRKLGQMGKLARRNSLMGLTKAFKKDKNKDADGGDSTLEPEPVKLGKKDKKKGAAAVASVSHATAEYDHASTTGTLTPSGMSPAAALARKQQQAYAEQEAAERAAAEEAAKLGPPSRPFEQAPNGQGGHQRNDSSDGSSIRSGRWGRNKADDAKSTKSSKWRLGFGGGGSKTDLAETSSLNSDAGSAFTATAGPHYHPGADGDATPRQSLEVLAPPQGYPTYGARPDGQESEGEYEPSLYRDGAVPRPAKAVKGILKGAGTYRQEDYAIPRMPYNRNRASSFDAPQQHGRPGSPGGGGAALVNVIPSEQQVDGVAPSATSPRQDTHPPSATELLHDAALARESPSTGPYQNPGLNASAPVLTHFASQPSIRSASAPGATGRRINFASNLSVHTTWPAAIYDRRAEPATCNRLTPALAQQIKEELNSFKMEEMDVHPSSRKLTHFFV
ncbi:hypothetical protein JCM10213_004169 [Rhodosporidiobolus nylandii]